MVTILHWLSILCFGAGAVMIFMALGDPLFAVAAFIVGAVVLALAEVVNWLRHRFGRQLD